MIPVREKSILVILFLLSLFLLNTHMTSADLYAEQTVKNNILKATTIAFSQRNTANNYSVSTLFSVIGLLPGGFDVKAVRIQKDGAVLPKYRLYPLFYGDQRLCNELQLKIIRKDIVIYQGQLKDGIIDTVLSDKEKNDWIFILGLENKDLTLRNLSCSFEFIFKSWRTDPGQTSGLYSETRLSNQINTGNWN